MTPKNERKNQTEKSCHTRSRACMNPCQQKQARREPPTNNAITWTRVWTLYTPPLAGQQPPTSPPGPKKQRTEAKYLEEISRRSCHHHNPTA